MCHQKIIEILTWKAKDDVSDAAMIQATDNMVADLKQLPGFISQTLYKNNQSEWVDVYYWESEEAAHASNTLMGDKASLAELMTLIIPETITMDVMPALQSSEK